MGGVWVGKGQGRVVCGGVGLGEVEVGQGWGGVGGVG